MPVDDTIAQTFFQEGLQALRNLDIEAAGDFFDKALKINFQNNLLIKALKAQRYWLERSRKAFYLQDEFARSEYFFTQWYHFLHFSENIDLFDESILFVFRQFAFGSILSFLSRINVKRLNSDPEVLYRVGIALKGIGSFEAAQKALESANLQQKDCPYILADLADAYAHLGNDKLARVLYREAFYIDPQLVRLETLESVFITVLIKEVQDLGYQQPALSEWVPIYGHLKKVFSVKRELRSNEYSRLMHDIHHLEREILVQNSESPILKPRLINKYFWLIDYYIQHTEHSHRIDDVLLRLKSLSTEIYEQYTR